MSTLQSRWHMLRTLVSRPAFIVISAAAVALSGANAALLSLLHPYARPETLTTLIAAVDLMRTLFSLWLGVNSLC